MGQNKTMASPEAYPSAFLSIIRDGAGILYVEDLPWTTISAAKRFRLLLALLKKSPHHPLHRNAMQRWSVRYSSKALECTATIGKGTMESLTGALIDRALKIGVNP